VQDPRRQELDFGAAFRAGSAEIPPQVVSARRALAFPNSGLLAGIADVLGQVAAVMYQV